MACVLCVKFKQACGPTHGEDNRILEITKRVAWALKGQKEAMKTQ